VAPARAPVEALLFLELLNDLEAVTGMRVNRAEHSHEAPGRSFRAATQLREPDRRVDVVAKDRLPGVGIPGEEAFNTITQKLVSKRGSCNAAAAVAADASGAATQGGHFVQKFQREPREW